MGAVAPVTGARYPVTGGQGPFAMRYFVAKVLKFSIYTLILNTPIAHIRGGGTIFALYTQKTSAVIYINYRRRIRNH